jgi:hypothetical protein
MYSATYSKINIGGRELVSIRLAGRDEDAQRVRYHAHTMLHHAHTMLHHAHTMLHQFITVLTKSRTSLMCTF